MRPRAERVEAAEEELGVLAVMPRAVEDDIVRRCVWCVRENRWINPLWPLTRRTAHFRLSFCMPVLVDPARTRVSLCEAAEGLTPLRP